MFYIIREYPANYQLFIVASNRDGKQINSLTVMNCAIPRTDGIYGKI